MDFLKKHARFLIVLVVLAVLLYFANGQLKDYNARVEAARTKARVLLSANYEALFRDAGKYGEPATVQGRKVQDRTQVLQQTETGRNELMAFVTDPEFTLASLPEGSREDDHVNYYLSRVLGLQREFSLRQYFVPDAYSQGALGFDATRKGMPAADVPGNLRRLDIARATVDSCGRSGVLRVLRLKFVEITNELNSRGVPVTPAAEGEQPYFAAQGLEIEVRARETALYNLLAELQRPTKGQVRGRYLSIEKFRMEKPDLMDPADDLVHATLTVAAWHVNEQSSFPRDKGATDQPQSSTRAPRPFR